MHRRFAHTGFFGLATTMLVSLAAPARALDDSKDIVDTAVGAGGFTTLVKAVKAAGLVETLKGDGPFTVFAPTDDAFAKLPKAKLEALLKDKSALTAVLTYHVVPGKVLAEDVVKLSTAKTVQGKPVSITVDDGKVKVNQANVLKTDIICTNGVIHVIDSVIMPPAAKDVVDTAVGAGGFKTLVAAVKAAGLVETLKGKGPFTVFAPTDEAFAKIPKEKLDALLKDKAALTAILAYHVVPGKVMAADVVKLDSAKTLQGKTVKIESSDGKVKVNDSNVTKTDIDCANGVIHVIDGVLLPPTEGADAGKARRMIEDAVARGARAFNAGHHADCAALYMSTMKTLVSHTGAMSEDVAAGMTRTIDEATHTACMTQRSWILRHGLDRAYAGMIHR